MTKEEKKARFIEKGKNEKIVNRKNKQNNC